MRTLMICIITFLALATGATLYGPQDRSRERNVAEVTQILSFGSRIVDADQANASEITKSRTSNHAKTQVAALTQSNSVRARDAYAAAVHGATIRTIAPVIDANTPPVDVASRAALVRDLQGALRKLGCYLGRVDGSWGPISQAAMRQFNSAVNAQLPTAEPDYILLALVRNHGATRDNICAEAHAPQRDTERKQQVAALSTGQTVAVSDAQPNRVIGPAPTPNARAIRTPSALPPEPQTENVPAIDTNLSVVSDRTRRVLADVTIRIPIAAPPSASSRGDRVDTPILRPAPQPIRMAARELDIPTSDSDSLPITETVIPEDLIDETGDFDTGPIDSVEPIEDALTPDDDPDALPPSAEDDYVPSEEERRPAVATPKPKQLIKRTQDRAKAAADGDKAQAVRAKKVRLRKAAKKSRSASAKARKAKSSRRYSNRSRRDPYRNYRGHLSPFAGP